MFNSDRRQSEVFQNRNQNMNYSKHRMYENPTMDTKEGHDVDVHESQHQVQLRRTNENQSETTNILDVTFCESEKCDTDTEAPSEAINVTSVADMMDRMRLIDETAASSTSDLYKMCNSDTTNDDTIDDLRPPRSSTPNPEPCYHCKHNHEERCCLYVHDTSVDAKRYSEWMRNINGDSKTKTHHNKFKYTAQHDVLSGNTSPYWYPLSSMSEFQISTMERISRLQQMPPPVALPPVWMMPGLTGVFHPQLAAYVQSYRPNVFYYRAAYPLPLHHYM